MTSLVNELKENCLQDFSDLAISKGETDEYHWPWTFEKLQQDVSIISGIDASVGSEGYNPEWTVRTKSLVAILRDERYKAQKARLKEFIDSGRRKPTE